MNIEILGIRKLKWTRMGELNSDDHYIYYCGQESLRINGVALIGPTTPSEGTKFPLTVDENCIFVLGDNRGVSRDSRDPVIGQIDEREVLGKAIFLMIPGTSHGNLSRDFGRIGVVS